ncbi:hypothetical protein PLESTB_000895900 [Pleodorina starrii]|uniref:Metallo-beta-lactamase domain-containing protein n=1 Tax=Pleodorina starrii TaxID=330485 RepID=A0A9W6F3U2_9CHLO|nr:hypothetical protein PLESTM_000885100 [Pleodorina starrii]GLC54691.1 hypothetical protein PLESTB_000895900 [Pleodorina starrii]GLC67028.1 hypothetical protein PLESTF_000503600 [Pleodorina starrii]
MQLLPERACAVVGGKRDPSCLLYHPFAAKTFGFGPAGTAGAPKRPPGLSPAGAPGRGLTVRGPRSVITTATAHSPEDASASLSPRRQATLRPRTLRSAPQPTAPQQEQQQQLLAFAAAGDPRVSAAAAAAAGTRRRAAAEAPAPVTGGEARGGAVRSGAGTGTGAVRARDPASALRPQQQRTRQQSPPRQDQDQEQDHHHQQQQQWDLQPRQQQSREQLRDQREQQSRAVSSSGSTVHPTKSPRQTGFALRTGLALTFLGTNSGAPTLERNVSCTLVRLPGAVHMVDCGEGTHRQLMSLRGSLDLAEIDGIFITHLHGDHCFGLPAALGLLDEVKAAGQADPARRRHHVYGPPGLAELVRVSMISTGLTRRLQLPLTVTELVNSPAQAHPPLPLEQALQQHRPGLRAQRQRQQRGASSSSSSRDGEGEGEGGAGGGGGAAVLLQRLAAQRVQDAAELTAAVQAVQPRVAALEEIWSPPPPYPPAGRYGKYGQYGSRGGSYSGSDSDAPEQPSGSGDDDADEGGGAGGGGGSSFYRPFVAAEGLFWELPGCAGMRVRAAQLQHRVPCWGYVFMEARPYEEGARRRKVVVLGDTVSSRPIAPLAAGCDVMSHEATFARGMEAKARVAQHSTGWMAGAFAAAVGARSLVLTHFSARYREGPRDNLDYGRTSARSTSHLEAEQQSWAVAGLLREATATYGRPEHICAAADFYTHHVPPRLAAAAAAAASA